MKEVKKIKLWLEAKEVEYKDKKFTAFKTPIGGLNVDVKFKKDVKTPTVSGYYEFNTDEININTEGDYPVIWVKA